jgi:hypothetical protein
MLKTGDIVPIAVQLFDANARADVRARVYGVANQVLFEGPLQHIKDGFYETKQFRMPDMDYVIATYKVENSDEYGMSSETFYQDKTEIITSQLLDAQASKGDNYYQGIVSQESNEDFIEGFLNGTIET